MIMNCERVLNLDSNGKVRTRKNNMLHSCPLGKIPTSRENIKDPPIDISIESRALARPPRRGIREDPGRNQLCTASVYPDA